MRLQTSTKIAILVAAATAGLAVRGGLAHAQATGGDIDLDSFRPAMDSRGYITVNASQVLANFDLSFGLVTDWGHEVLRLHGGPFTQPMYGTGDAEYRVQNVISPTLQAAFGIAGFLEIGASLPFRVVSGTWDPDYIGDPTDPRDNDNFNFSSQGLGDLGLHAKLRLLDTSRFPIGLAVAGSVYIPAGHDEHSWLGENQTVERFSLILDKEWRRVRIAGNFGIELRGTARTFVDSGNGKTPAAPATGLMVTAKNELPFGAAIAFAVVREKFDIVAELTGSVPLDATNYQPLEALGAFKVYLARNSFFLLGGGAGLAGDKAANPDVRAFIGIIFEPNIGDRDGDGIKDDVDKCPDEPEDRDGFQDADGCPDPDNDQDGIPDEQDQCPNEPGPPPTGCPEHHIADRDGDGIPDDVDKCPDDPEDKDGFQDADGCPDPDNDQDGIPDVDDLCPNDPEDKDGFQDADGCPDPDNDNDRIPDKLDKCPNEPETYNGYQDEDGCPDKGRVIVHQGNIEILDKIYFETDKAIIKPESFPILDAIAATLQGNPDILLVEIQGHADERGSAEHNLQLTDDRAHSVLKYMTDKGVDAARLEAHGYGKNKPIAMGHNEAAWSKNRRVEFVIKQRK
jgi:outer membrane protein OmpA-like peptidoglycan-associated protein